MKKIFFSAAVMIAALLGFTACDKDANDENFDFSRTSWESSVDDDEVSGTLTLSFMDEKNGIVKGDFQGKDGQKHNTYHSFTYEAEMGRGVLHVTSELCIMGQYSSELFASMDLSFTLDKKSKTLELRSQEDFQTYSSTEYTPIYLPVTSMPEAGSTNIRLTRDMLFGSWTSFLKLGYDCTFSFYNYDGMAYSASIDVDYALGQLRAEWIHIRNLDFMIENNNTVVYLDKQNPDKVLYKLEFCDVNKERDASVYTVNLYDEDGDILLTDNIMDEKWRSF